MESLTESFLIEEKENMKKSNPMILVEYIKNSIDILVELKAEEKFDQFKKQSGIEDEDENQNEYEVLLRKLEADVRQHIRVKTN